MDVLSDETPPDQFDEITLRGDEAIADDVRRELREDAMIAFLSVDVAVNDGVVTLRGYVPHLEDADAAEEVAARVPGVVEVQDHLIVAGV
jgi:osmotically-inducible protein OsmY